MAAYKAILPDAAERIMAMAEEQAAHRQWCQKYILLTEARKTYVGQAAGFVIALAGFWAAYRLGLAGHDGLAGALGTADLVAIVTVFVAGRPQSDGGERPESTQQGSQADEQGKLSPRHSSQPR